MPSVAAVAARAYFSYNEHMRAVHRIYSQEDLEYTWRVQAPKKLGSVYGLVMRLLFEWDAK
eukprot:COSAG04_NODE_7349_length_1143_cov_1.002874_2_plen_61_part_00